MTSRPSPHAYFLLRMRISALVTDSEKKLIKRRNFLLIPSIAFLHKPNPWCLRMANPEPLPQRATRISRRLRGQEPVLESCPARVVGSAATPPSGGLSPNGDNSNPSLHHFWPLRETHIKLKKGCSQGGVTYDHLLPLH